MDFITTSATVLATLISAFIGSFVYQAWFDQVKKVRLERALRAELEENEGFSKVENLLSRENIEETSPSAIPTVKLTLLDSNIQKIGLLSTDEITTLIALREDISHYNYLAGIVAEHESWDVTSEVHNEDISENIISISESIIERRKSLLQLFSQNTWWREKLERIKAS